MKPTLTIRGVELYKHELPRAGQVALVKDILAVMRAAPPFSPITPYGKPMTVGMTSAGRYGWYSDRSGYRYVDRHPSGVEWPPIPDPVLRVWQSFTGLERLPDCCLVNFYRTGARMGLHQDRDEADFGWPVVSISLGDDALFRIGNLNRGGKTESVWLSSGDVVVLRGASRLIYHGVDRIKPGSSDLLPDGGRINLTLRVVDP